jgi:hypothetical protein
MLDVYKKQLLIGLSLHRPKEQAIHLRLIVRFIKSTSWQDKLVEFAEKFIQHQRDIGLCLTVTLHLTTARIENAITQISAIIRQESTTEAAFHQFVEAQGGLEQCMADDKLFAQLVKKSGVAIVLGEAQVSRHVPPAGPYYSTKRVSMSKPLPVSNYFQYATRSQRQESEHSHPVVYMSGHHPAGYPLAPPQIRHSRRSHRRRPTMELDYVTPRASRPITVNPPPGYYRRVAPFPMPRSPSPHIRHSHRRGRRLSPVSDRDYSPVRSVSRSRSPRRSRSRSRSPRRSRSRSHSREAPGLEDSNTTNMIAQLKIQVTSALETSLDVMIQKNASIWAIKFIHQTQVIQSFIESSKTQILKAIEHGHSGQHERVHDPQMRKLWESEVRLSLISSFRPSSDPRQKWRGSISNSTLLEGIHDYFWQFFQDAVAQGDFSQPIWTLQFMEKPYWAALSEVLDIDQSGLVSVAELNHFTDRKPQDLRYVALSLSCAIRCLSTIYKSRYISRYHRVEG